MYLFIDVEILPARSHRLFLRLRESSSSMKTLTASTSTGACMLLNQPAHDKQSNICVTFLLSPVQGSLAILIIWAFFRHPVHDGLAEFQAAIHCCNVKWSLAKHISWVLFCHLIHDEPAYVQATIYCSLVHWRVAHFTSWILVLDSVDDQLTDFQVAPPCSNVHWRLTLFVFRVLVLGMRQDELDHVNIVPLDCFPQEIRLAPQTSEPVDGVSPILAHKSEFQQSVGVKSVHGLEEGCPDVLLGYVVDHERESIRHVR